MKISVIISKTFQEESYEPIRIELAMERDLPDDESFQEVYLTIAEELQTEIDHIYLERQKFYGRKKK